MIKLVKTDWSRLITITIGKWQFVFGIQSILVLTKMYEATKSMDTIIQHQHNKYEHGHD